jgi:hypothetical protein
MRNSDAIIDRLPNEVTHMVVLHLTHVDAVSFALTFRLYYGVVLQSKSANSCARSSMFPDLSGSSLITSFSAGCGYGWCASMSHAFAVAATSTCACFRSSWSMEAGTISRGGLRTDVGGGEAGSILLSRANAGECHPVKGKLIERHCLRLHKRH